MSDRGRVDAGLPEARVLGTDLAFNADKAEVISNHGVEIVAKFVLETDGVVDRNPRIIEAKFQP